MTDIDLTAAIERGRDAAFNGWDGGRYDPYTLDSVNIGIRAAAPLIAAQVREQVAAEIEAFLREKFSPPIWFRCVDVADPTYDERHYGPLDDAS